MKGDDQYLATGATPERISVGELRPDDRGQDEMREALEESIGQGEARPLIHPHARAAALAAEAAGAQTDFWTMHEYLFEHQHALAQCDLHKYAVELRLDADRFEHDRRSSRVRERVDRDLASGEASGVQGTPTFYVNGIRHDGSYDVDSLRSAVVGHLGSGSEHQRERA